MNAESKTSWWNALGRFVVIRVVPYVIDISIMTNGALCALGIAGQVTVNVSYWIAAISGLTGMAMLLVADEKMSNQPEWWDQFIRLFQIICFVCIGWWWVVTCWTLHWLGYNVMLVRAKKKTSATPK